MKKLILLLLAPALLFSAAEFPGTLGVDLGCGSDTALDNMSSLVISVWVRPDNAGGGDEGRIVRKRAASFGEGWGLIIWDKAGKLDTLRFFIARSTTNTFRASATTTPFTYDGNWHHVLLTSDMGTAFSGTHLYFDGAEVSYGDEQNGSGTFDDSAGSLHVGTDDEGGTSTGQFDGGMACLAIWNNKSSISARGLATISQPKCSMAFHVGELGQPTRFWSFFNGAVPLTDITAPGAPDMASGGTNCSGLAEVAEQPFGW